MKFFDVFKAGNYPQGTFSEQDVESLACNYDPKFCEAPITLDHEQRGPAYGWVSGLKSENGKLKASFRDVAPELKDFVQSGKYRKISVEIYKELEGRKPYLKAVSFLGACIPQVKGMDPVEFKDGETETYIFEVEARSGSEQGELIHEILPEIKMNEELIKLQNQISEMESQIVLFIDQPNVLKNNELVVNLQEKVKKMSVQILTLQDESVARQKAEDELSTLKQEIKRNEFEQFLDVQIASGKLLASQKDLGLKIFMALDNFKQFADCEQRLERSVMPFIASNQADESNFTEDFKQFLSTLTKQIEFEEIAKKPETPSGEEDILEFSNASEDSIAIYNEAKQLSERDKISFKDALLKLYK